MDTVRCKRSGQTSTAEDSRSSGRTGGSFTSCGTAPRTGRRWRAASTGTARTDGMATLAVEGSGWLAKPYAMHALLEAVRSLTAAG